MRAVLSLQPVTMRLAVGAERRAVHIMPHGREQAARADRAKRHRAATPPPGHKGEQCRRRRRAAPRAQAGPRSRRHPPPAFGVPDRPGTAIARSAPPANWRGPFVCSSAIRSASRMRRSCSSFSAASRLRSLFRLLRLSLVVAHDAVADEREDRRARTRAPRVSAYSCARSPARGPRAGRVRRPRRPCGAWVSRSRHSRNSRSSASQSLNGGWRSSASCATSITSASLPAVPDQQALLGEAVDERPRLGRNFLARRHAAHELAGRVDLREMRNEGRARELELLLLDPSALRPWRRPRRRPARPSCRSRPSRARFCRSRRASARCRRA